MQVRDRFSQLYDQLLAVVSRTLRPRQRAELTADDVLHETFLKLRQEEARRQRQQRSVLGDKSTGSFKACVGAACRDVLADHARRRGASKRGGAVRHQELPSNVMELAADPLDVIVTREAMAALAQLDPQLARLVAARAFDGKTIAECAAEFGSSPRSVDRQWAFCRAWLQRRLPHALPALPA